MYFKMDQSAEPQDQRSQCSIQHGRNHTANNIYKCWTSCNKRKYLFLQYSVTNQKHNSCKIYLKIIQVVSKGRTISWLAGGVVGYDSERGLHKDHSTKVWSQLVKLVSEEKILNDFFVEFSIFSNGGHLGWDGIIGYNSERGPHKHHQSCQV
jgi:hypothetical protein